MATPKKRTSPVRSGNRRRNLGLTLPLMVACAQCGAKKISHQACPSCGSYRGRAVKAGTGQN